MKKFKNKKIIIYVISIVLILIFISIWFVFHFLNRDYYSIEPREKNIQEAKEENKDYTVIGWLRVQGTNIDHFLMGKTKYYPIDIEKYAWVQTNDNKYHNVLNIFGHNVLNLGSKPLKYDEMFTRFEEVVPFLYYDYAKDKKYIQLTMNGKDYIYQIVAVGIMPNYYAYDFPIGEYTKEQKQNYLDIIDKYSIYDYNVSKTVDDNYITLITCTRFYGSKNDSIYVSAKLVDNGKYPNYGIRKNKNYKKVEDTLKDGVGNEEGEDI